MHVCIYGTAQFKFDIRTRVLVQWLKNFLMELMSFSRVHDLWNVFDPHDELHAHGVRSSIVYFTRKQSSYT